MRNTDRQNALQAKITVSGTGKAPAEFHLISHFRPAPPFVRTSLRLFLLLGKLPPLGGAQFRFLWSTVALGVVLLLTLLCGVVGSFLGRSIIDLGQQIFWCCKEVSYMLLSANKMQE
jgi:hypothetical protein